MNDQAPFQGKKRQSRQKTSRSGVKISSREESKNRAFFFCSICLGKKTGVVPAIVYI
jgi:hypothetical protein